MLAIALGLGGAVVATTAASAEDLAPEIVAEAPVVEAAPPDVKTTADVVAPVAEKPAVVEEVPVVQEAPADQQAPVVQEAPAVQDVSVARVAKSATPVAEEQGSNEVAQKVCPENQDGYGKHLPGTRSNTLVYTAPAGFLVGSYCVKAGSANQGEGPVIRQVNPPKAKVTIDHPTKDSISHYSVKLVPAVYEVGFYVYKKLNPGAPASWPNSGVQDFIKAQKGIDYFTSFPGELPSTVCGDGWGVQQDKVKHGGEFTWPQNITYPHDNIGWPPIYAAQHQELDAFFKGGVPDCPVPPKECIVTSKSWFTESDDTVPTVEENGIRFVGGVKDSNGLSDSVGTGIALSGNLQGLPAIDYVAEGTVGSMALFYPRIVIDAGIPGLAYNSLTVTSEGQVNGSSTAAGREVAGGLRVSKTLDQWETFFPNNTVRFFFFNTDSSSTAAVSVLLKSVTAGKCLMTTWGAGPKPPADVKTDVAVVPLTTYDCTSLMATTVTTTTTTVRTFTYTLVNGAWVRGEGVDAISSVSTSETRPLTHNQILKLECPPPKPDVKTDVAIDPVTTNDCKSLTATTITTTTTTVRTFTYTLVDGAWVRGEGVDAVSSESTSETRPLTNNEILKLECEPPTTIIQYGDWVVGEFGCGDTTVIETRTVSTTTFSLVNGVWVGSPVITTEPSTVPLTKTQIKQLECPVQAPPTFIDKCGTADDSFTFTKVDGIRYKEDDGRVKGVGTVAIRAFYASTGIVINTWRFQFTDAACPVFAPPTLSLPEQQAGGGTQQNNPIKPIAAGTPTVSDLPTLAVTGANESAGIAGLVALLLTLTGVGMVVTRRRMEV